jgi:hypothetical protein
MNKTIHQETTETYKITVVIQVVKGGLKHDNWIYRALEDCLENKEQLISYRMEVV